MYSDDPLISELEGRPAGVWSAPGRVNLIGEHTDYNNGLALPFAIDRRTWATVARTDRPGLHLATDQPEALTATVQAEDLRPGRVEGWAAYVAGVFWALGVTDQLVDEGMAVSLSSSVPVGAGLSSSAAVLCSVASAVNDLFELGHTPMSLADVTQEVENDFVGAPTGGMDQRASLMGRENHALLFDVKAGWIKPVPFDPESAGLVVLAVDTRVAHAHVDGGYAARRADCERAAALLGIESLREIDPDGLTAERERLVGHGPDGDRIHRRARHVVTENARVEATVEALGEQDWARVGSLLVEAHHSIRDDFEASCPELDLAVETMVAAGAPGARMTGGGFGGTAIGLVPIDTVDAVGVEVTTAFTAAGFDPPALFSVSPSDGARRDR